MENKYTVGNRFRNETNGLICEIVFAGNLYKVQALDGKPSTFRNTEYMSEEEIDTYLRRRIYTKIEPF